MPESLAWTHALPPPRTSRRSLPDTACHLSRRAGARPGCGRASFWQKSASQRWRAVSMKAIDVLAAAMLIGSGVAGCASTEAMPAASPGHELRTFAPGWERFFTLSWQAGQQNGRPILSGAVSNQYGATATRVQLLGEALDDKGGVVSQRVVWLGDSIEPYDTAIFNVPVGPATNYRVSIFAYDWGGRASGV